MVQPISIDVIIVSDNTDLETRIRAIAASHITLNISTCHVYNKTYCDILIYDMTSIKNKLPKANECLECVLYAGQDKASSVLLAETVWTAFWQQPMSDNMLEFYLRQLVISVQSKKELSTTKTFLNTLIDSVPDLIWFKDLKGSHLKVNDAFGRAVGKTKEQCEGRGHYYIWDLEPDEYAKGEFVCLETEEEVIRRKETCLFDEKVKSKNGLRQFKTYKSPLVDERGEMFGTVGIAKDVTDLQNIGQEMEVILASIPFGAMIVDIDDSIVSVNQQFCEYFKVTTEEIMHMNYNDVCVKILHTTPHELGNKQMTELRYDAGDKQRVFSAQQQSIHDIFDNHFGMFFICLDVTKEYELQHRILHSANTDFLTGLYNRRYFYEALGEKRDSQQLDFVYFDLDNFKMINDTYGHQSGDDALIIMASLLKKAFPKQLISRFGGDEFVVAFLNDSSTKKLVQEVENFIKQVDTAFYSTKNMKDLTVSAGVACNGSCKNVDALLSRADKALYEAKSLGKSRYVVYPE